VEGGDGRGGCGEVVRGGGGVKCGGGRGQGEEEEVEEYVEEDEGGIYRRIKRSRSRWENGEVR